MATTRVAMERAAFPVWVESTKAMPLRSKKSITATRIRAVVRVSISSKGSINSAALDSSAIARVMPARSRISGLSRA